MHHLHIQPIIAHYGYAGVFFILLLEVIGIPFPAETTLTFSGIAFAHGTFAFLPLCLYAAGGNLLGSVIAYWIGRMLGRPFIERYGHYVRLTPERLDRVNQKFSKYQGLFYVMAKFIAGIRVLVPYIAGVNRMGFLTFLGFNAAGAVLWVSTFVVLGRYIDIGWTHYQEAVQDVWLPVVIAAGIAALALIFLRRLRHHKRDVQHHSFH